MTLRYSSQGVGARDGICEIVGLRVGTDVGFLVGFLVGLLVGSCVGLRVGVDVGDRVGDRVGFPVGDRVGVDVTPSHTWPTFRLRPGSHMPFTTLKDSSS